MGEALGLQWSDVDFEASMLKVQRALYRVRGEWVVVEPKTRAGRRTISLPREALDDLSRQRAQQSQRLAGSGEQAAGVMEGVLRQ